MTTTEIVLLIGISALTLIIFLYTRRLDKKFSLALGTMIGRQEDYFRTLHRTIWLLNKDRITQRVYVIVNTYINRSKAEGNNKISLPLKVGLTADALDNGTYKYLINSVKNLSAEPSYIDTKLYVIAIPLDNFKEVYSVICTGPVGRDKFLECYTSKMVTEINMEEYIYVRSTRLHKPIDGTIVGYFVKKNSTINLDGDSVIDQKANEFNWGLQYCKYLLDIVSVPQNDEVYLRYTNLINKGITIPSKEEEDYLRDTLEIIKSSYGDLIHSALSKPSDDTEVDNET